MIVLIAIEKVRNAHQTFDYYSHIHGIPSKFTCWLPLRERQCFLGVSITLFFYQTLQPQYMSTTSDESVSNALFDDCYLCTAFECSRLFKLIGNL